VTALRVIGVDPGPVPGIVMLDYFETGYLDRAEAIQATHGIAVDLVTGLLIDAGSRLTPVLVAVESFVVSRRSGRSSTPGASVITRELIGQLQRAVALTSVSSDDTKFLQNNASRVKHWATDDRLKRVQVPHSKGQSLLDLTVGMRHARDAARHALFAAVGTGPAVDPLSKHAHSSTEGAPA